MRKSIILFLLLMTMCSYGLANDSLKIVSLQREINNLKSRVSVLQQENDIILRMYQVQAAQIDSMMSVQNKQTGDIDTLSATMTATTIETRQRMDSNVSTLTNNINTRSWIAAAGIIFALCILAITYVLLRKKISRGSSSIEKIKAAQESLESAQKAIQVESVKLDGKLVELLESYLKQSPTQEQDHSLILSIATEVARIEQNIAFMDTKVKGVSNLKNRASAINATLKAKGYEIPRLVGEKYHDGDNMVPTMELDEELPVGTQIIRRVLKPMVLYNGKMIQAAHVVVAFNE